MRSWRSLARYAVLNSGFSNKESSGMATLPGFNEQIHARGFSDHGEQFRRRLLWFETLDLLRVAIDQVPIQQVLHPISNWVGGIDICCQQHSARSQPAIKDVHESLADCI